MYDCIQWMTQPLNLINFNRNHTSIKSIKSLFSILDHFFHFWSILLKFCHFFQFLINFYQFFIETQKIIKKWSIFDQKRGGPKRGSKMAQKRGQKWPKNGGSKNTPKKYQKKYPKKIRKKNSFFALFLHFFCTFFETPPKPYDFSLLSAEKGGQK